MKKDRRKQTAEKRLPRKDYCEESAPDICPKCLPEKTPIKKAWADRGLGQRSSEKPWVSPQICRIPPFRSIEFLAFYGKTFLKNLFKITYVCSSILNQFFYSSTTWRLSEGIKNNMDTFCGQGPLGGSKCVICTKKKRDKHHIMTTDSSLHNMYNVRPIFV